jgi:hypothetical protein
MNGIPCEESQRRPCSAATAGRSAASRRCFSSSAVAYGAATGCRCCRRARHADSVAQENARAPTCWGAPKMAVAPYPLKISMTRQIDVTTSRRRCAIPCPVLKRATQCTGRKPLTSVIAHTAIKCQKPRFIPALARRCATALEPAVKVRRCRQIHRLRFPALVARTGAAFSQLDWNGAVIAAISRIRLIQLVPVPTWPIPILGLHLRGARRFPAFPRSGSVS